MALNYTLTPNLDAPGTKEDLNNDAFYQVHMNYSGFGQVFKNILHYRVGLGGLPGGINLGGAEHLANLVYELLWSDFLRDATGVEYKLEDITVYPFNADYDFMFSNPHVRPVDELGAAGGSSAGPASTVTVAFNLEGTVVGINGWFPPKRGHIASLPYRENDVGPDGRLSNVAQSFYVAKFACLANDLSGLPWPVTYWPIRVSVTKLLGVFTLRGFADIRGTYIRDIGHYRRSRLPEI